MITDYLDKKSEETMTAGAFDSLVGEEIAHTIPIDPERYMLLMASQTSVIFHTAGSFTVYNKEATLKILNKLKESLGFQANSHNKVCAALEQEEEEAENDEETAQADAESS